MIWKVQLWDQETMKWSTPSFSNTLDAVRTAHNLSHIHRVIYNEHQKATSSMRLEAYTHTLKKTGNQALNRTSSDFLFWPYNLPTRTTNATKNCQWER